MLDFVFGDSHLTAFWFWFRLGRCFSIFLWVPFPSSPCIGNPMGLFTSLGTGVSDFFFEPIAGLTRGPAEFALGTPLPLLVRGRIPARANFLYQLQAERKDLNHTFYIVYGLVNICICLYLNLHKPSHPNHPPTH